MIAKEQPPLLSHICVCLFPSGGGNGALLNNEVHESGNVAYGDGAVSIHVACIILFGCSENHVHQFGYIAHVHYAVAIDVAGNYGRGGQRNDEHAAFQIHGEHIFAFCNLVGRG